MVLGDIRAALVSDEGFGIGPLCGIVSKNGLLHFGVMLPLSFFGEVHTNYHFVDSSDKGGVTIVFAGDKFSKADKPNAVNALDSFVCEAVADMVADFILMIALSFLHIANGRMAFNFPQSSISRFSGSHRLPGTLSHVAVPV